MIQAAGEQEQSISMETQDGKCVRRSLQHCIGFSVHSNWERTEYGGQTREKQRQDWVEDTETETFVTDDKCGE